MDAGEPRHEDPVQRHKRVRRFQNQIFASFSQPPFRPFLAATRIDVPATHPRPWEVNMGGGHGGHFDETVVRPLCAPIKRASWGIKADQKQHHIMSGSVYLPSDGEGNGLLFVSTRESALVSFDVRRGRLTGVPYISRIDFKRFPFATLNTSGHPGGSVSVSANARSKKGIVWVSHYRDPGVGSDATFRMHEGVLEAFDVETLDLLWSSDSALKDRVGPFQKFTPPTVANGRVYLASAPHPIDPEACVAATLREDNPRACSAVQHR